ncbi:MAG TPA: Ku protein [Steroidobacteraceae bacterium]|nr:Ku protein [Steroidobacteraceae bacterium]
MARAIWKGVLNLGREQVPVKMYSAVEDRTVHFRVLHARDRAPVEQHIVRKDNGREVPKEERRKAFPLDRNTAVVLQPEELEKLEPPPSRDIHICRFISPSLLSDQWYDRPYYLGPDRDAESYFALVAALERQEVTGIARWVMRKKRYLGALAVSGGYLAMITLRRADQVLSFSQIEPAKTATPHDNEVRLAEQLVSTIASDFAPEQWQDEYRKRLCALIEAKARGEKIAPVKPKRAPAPAGLAESLRASIAAARERHAA